MKTGRYRIYLLLAATVLGYGAVISRLYRIQVTDHDLYEGRSISQTQRNIRVERERGTIFDRRGRELAVSIRVRSLAANPRKFLTLDERIKTAERLAPVVGVASEDIVRRLQRPGEFSWVARKLSDTAAAAVAEMDIPGLFFESEFQRVYPHNSLLSHVLGFVGVDDEGLEGIEKSFDDYLRGPDLTTKFAHDAFGNPIPLEGRIAYPEFDGYSLELTVDMAIQAVLEEAISRQVEAFDAKSASAVVIDPVTGEILAIANFPTYDLNDAGGSSESQKRNRAITDIFEPGSAFKVFSGSIALENEKVKRSEQFNCPGFVQLAGHTIRCHKTHGRLTYPQTIEVSCNVAAIDVARRLDADVFHRVIGEFGFGEKTGIGLIGEVAGLLRPVEKWSGLSTAMIGMGQEVGVTTLQLAMATAALANKGRLMTPRIVRTIRKPRSGQPEKIYHPEVRRQVISPRAAGAMAEIMKGVVDNGTGQEAKIPFFSVAGKTGTAQVAGVSGGGYIEGKYNSVFIGWTPVEAPILAMAIVVREPDPTKGHYGGAVAAPLFGWVASEALGYMRVVPENAAIESEHANTLAWKKRTRERIRSAGEVRDGRVVVPDLKGLTLREVQEVMSALPLDFRPTSSGVAVSQEPPAGAIVPIDAIVKVSFSQPGGSDVFADIAAPSE